MKDDATPLLQESTVPSESERPGKRLRRRDFLVLGGVAFVVPALPRVAMATPPRDLAFDVLRDDTPIGSHSIRFRRDGTDLRVEVAIDLEVQVLFITAYRYRHRNRENWRDGRLLSIRTFTDDDGTEYAMVARATGTGLLLQAAADDATLPPDILPSSFWHPDLVYQDRLLNTQDGQVLAVRFDPGATEEIRGDGGTLAARRFTCRGDLELDLWRDDEEHLARLRFRAIRDGSIIDYVRRPPAG